MSRFPLRKLIGPILGILVLATTEGSINFAAAQTLASNYVDCGTECVNLALHRPASLSSLFNPMYPASAAVDGYTGMGSGSISSAALGAWWVVDLGAITSVRSVIVNGRADCCADQSSNLNVGISKDGIHWTRKVIAGSTSGGVRVDFADEARWVGVETRSNNVLSLQEVEVIGRRYFAPDASMDLAQKWGITDPGPRFEAFAKTVLQLSATTGNSFKGVPYRSLGIHPNTLLVLFRDRSRYVQYVGWYDAGLDYENHPMAMGIKPAYSAELGVTKDHIAYVQGLPEPPDASEFVNFNPLRTGEGLSFFIAYSLEGISRGLADPAPRSREEASALENGFYPALGIAPSRIFENQAGNELRVVPHTHYPDDPDGALLSYFISYGHDAIGCSRLGYLCGAQDRVSYSNGSADILRVRIEWPGQAEDASEVSALWAHQKKDSQLFSRIFHTLVLAVVSQGIGEIVGAGVALGSEVANTTFTAAFTSFATTAIGGSDLKTSLLAGLGAGAFAYVGSFVVTSAGDPTALVGVSGLGCPTGDRCWFLEPLNGFPPTSNLAQVHDAFVDWSITAFGAPANTAWYRAITIPPFIVPGCAASASCVTGGIIIATEAEVE